MASSTEAALRSALRAYYVQVQGSRTARDFVADLRRIVPRDGRKVKLSKSTVEKLRTPALNLTVEHIALLADVQQKPVGQVLIELGLLALEEARTAVVIVHHGVKPRPSRGARGASHVPAARIAPSSARATRASIPHPVED